jgi:hypothetical protein
VFADDAGNEGGSVFLTYRDSDGSKPFIESMVSRPVGSLEPVKASVRGRFTSVSSSAWLYIQSEALQDIPFHLHPGLSPAPSARKITVLSRCGEG